MEFRELEARELIDLNVTLAVTYHKSAIYVYMIYCFIEMISNVFHSLFSFCLRNEMKNPFVIHVREAPKRWSAISYFLKKKTG